VNTFNYRKISTDDISKIAEIRAANTGTLSHWTDRITQYLSGEVSPQKALQQRVIYVAQQEGLVIGFAAGHLTKRFECDGELQWIDTRAEVRRQGVASHLLKLLAEWFALHNARKICVDPGNEIARNFYRKNGARMLDQHWMYWEDIRRIL
jgi:ribosomal protein S18 acetylase RimI-like enzyme